MAAKKQTSGAKVTSKNTETELVAELANILNETELAEIEIKKGDLKIRVTKHTGHHIVQTSAAMPVAPMPSAAAATATPAPAATENSAAPAKADLSNHPGIVKSPMVGTAYTRPSPDADPFVKVGDSVSEGDTILLVEAMKTFNPITASKSGTIEALLVNDADPVEFGEPLFIIA